VRVIVVRRALILAEKTRIDVRDVRERAGGAIREELLVRLGD
jgi:hypothetical protein